MDRQEHTYLIVQYWVPRYEYWSTVSEPAEEMFGVPRSTWETEEDARAKRDELQGEYPEGRYRVAKVTTITEVVA